MDWHEITEMPSYLHNRRVLLAFGPDWKEGVYNPAMFPLGFGPTHYMEVTLPVLPLLNDVDVARLHAA